MRAALLLLPLALGGCPMCDEGPPDALGGYGERFAEGDIAFHRDPRWMGGDAAYSIDLGDDRSVWLFGDSFIANTANYTRQESTMIRNSLAVMTGQDPRDAMMDFHWQKTSPPASWVNAEGDHWLWPGDGVRQKDGPLIITYSELAPSSEGLGFAAAGWRAIRVPDPSGPPETWTIEPVATHPVPFAPEASVGACGVVNGSYWVALSVDKNHDGRLVRWPIDDMANGDMSGPQWWTGGAWIGESDLHDLPAVVIPDAPTECSLTGSTFGFTLIHSRGFGFTTVAMRNAYYLTGPWGEPIDVFTPPESETPNAFVYAAKGHVLLDPCSPNFEMQITYADNSFTFADLFDPAREQTLYYPHFARLSFYPRYLC